LLTLLEEYPCESRSFKGVKYIFFRWAMQLIPETPEVVKIIAKLMICFFDDRLNLRVNLGEDFF
jgi:hypothetical protein